MKLYIKNMVSLRCIMFVQSELEKIGINYTSVELGLIEIQDGITEDQFKVIKEALEKAGLEILEDKKNTIVEKIKSLIAEMVHYSEEFQKVKITDYISEKVGYDYTYLSNTFSELMGICIQQYIILYKMERVKELLLYDELSLTEISYKLGYSSVAHLSNQFKQITGITPSYFKELKDYRFRKQLNAL